MVPHPIVKRITLVVIGLSFFLPAICLADWSDLTAQQLKGLLDSGQKLFLLNPLSDLEFNEGHIPGSVNIPLHTIMRSKELPEDKNYPIVTYCLSQK